MEDTTIAVLWFMVHRHSMLPGKFGQTSSDSETGTPRGPWWRRRRGSRPPRAAASAVLSGSTPGGGHLMAGKIWENERGIQI